MTAVAHPELRAPRARALPLTPIAFGLVAAAKIALLIAYGPIMTPDSGGYVAYAQALRTSVAWMMDAGLTQGAVPVTAIRMIGYPAIIAAAMTLFGVAWAIGLVVLQGALSLLTSYALYRLALAIGLPPLAALAAVVADMLSLRLTYDQCILTDSFYASLVILATVALARAAIAAQPLSWRRALAAGMLFMLAFLQRDAMQVLIIAFLPLIALAAWQGGRARRLRAALCCALIVLPLFGAAELYKRWNEARTGERFVTTVAQITVLHGLAKIAPSDPTLFAGDTPLDRVGAKLFRGDPFGESMAANNELFAQGYKATDIARMAFAHYFRSWRDHPATMLALLKRNTSERVAKLTVRPIAAVCESIEFATGERRCYDYRDLYRALPKGFTGLPWTAAVFFLAQTLELTLAIALFAGFFVGVPALMARQAVTQRGLDQATLLIASFWMVYVAWYLAHGIVHVEDRYMAPVLPLSLIGGLFAWRALHRWRRERAGARA